MLIFPLSPFHLFVILFYFLVCPKSAFPHQTVMVSLEGLTKIVDPSQLTADFEGSLEYNHDEWIEVLILFFCLHLFLHKMVFNLNLLCAYLRKHQSKTSLIADLFKNSIPYPHWGKEVDF